MKLTFKKPKKLLNLDQNAKTVKGQKFGYKTAILYLAPASSSGFNVCPQASLGCKASCLNTAGMGIFKSVQDSRINKTRWYILERDSFMAQLKKELTAFVIKCKKEKIKPCVRLNGTSDIEWNSTGIFNDFKNVQFYDYTKIYKRAIRWIKGEYPKNYHLTYSLNEDNKTEAFNVLKMGGNISAVFRTPKLPTIYKGFKVLDADKSDLRFKDKKNSIAGLYAKGKARHDTTGFVLDI
jgi:hypothetical protein